MSDYLCGHDRKPIFLTNNPTNNSFNVTMAKWAVWKCTTGYEGDKTQCFKCYCKKAEPQVRQDKNDATLHRQL